MVCGDCGVIGSAGKHEGFAVLLRCVGVVGDLIVDGDVIELRGRLVVPGGPGGSTIDADADALIGGLDHARGVFRIDPQRMIVVAAGRTFQHGEGFAAVGGTIDCDVRQVYDVGIAWIDGDATEVPGAAVDARIGGDLCPGFARGPGAEKLAPGICLDDRGGAHAPRSAGSLDPRCRSNAG